MLKTIQPQFGPPLSEPFDKATSASIDDRLAKSAYYPSEASLATFQNRGGELDRLKDVIQQGSEKVIVITGMPGIGKTSLIKASFSKITS